ncbi:TonB-dependent receptor [Bermanella marisrubri]|uniref:TonB-dependent receptor plug domain-containing protein n=1 Tax=Bermanella marisrubri TaxID=207949 RepID=UPI001402B9CF|nr:TonB-dependent receptor [Bermanella marisrubri]QIZ83422.1 TonB-dependent receptor [Bermanella marisrubri]
MQELQSIPVEVASLFEDDALDVASSVAVIDRSDWQTRDYHTLSNGLESVPSVFSNSTWGGTEIHAIRGFASELSVRGIAYSLEDVPLGTYVYASTGYMFPRAPLGILDQVEMIRGPGSTLYGTDAFHGVINYQLREPDLNNTQVTLKAGSHDWWGKGTDVTHSQYSGQWQIHTGFTHHNESSHGQDFRYTDPFTGDQEIGTREQAWSSNAGFLKIKHGQVSSNAGQWQAMVFANQYRGEGFTGIGQQLFKGFDGIIDLESFSLAQSGDQTNNESELMLARLGHEILLDNDIQLKQRIYTWHSKQEWQFDNTQYPESVDTISSTTLNCRENTADTASDTIASLYCSHYLYQGADESRSGYEIQAKQRTNAWNTQWVVGAGFDRIHVDESEIRREAPDGEIRLRYVNPFQDKSREISYAFAQGRSGFFNDQLLVTYGVRWDQYSDVSDHASPRLGVVHRLASNWSHKLLYGHAYRAPTAIEFLGSGPFLGNENLKAEVIDTHEYVLQYIGSQLQWETTVFYSEWDDAIAVVQTGSETEQQYVNLNSNYSKGVEFSLKGLQGPWHFQGNASYVETDTSSTDVNFKAFPEWMMSANLEYRGQGWQAGIWQRQQWQYELTDNVDEQSGKEDYSRTDFYAQYKVQKNSSLGLAIYNVADVHNTLPSYYASENGLPQHGREWSVHYTMDF